MSLAIGQLVWYLHCLRYFNQWSLTNCTLTMSRVVSWSKRNLVLARVRPPPQQCNVWLRLLQGRLRPGKPPLVCSMTCHEPLIVFLTIFCSWSSNNMEKWWCSPDRHIWNMVISRIISGEHIPSFQLGGQTSCSTSMKHVVSKVSILDPFILIFSINHLYFYTDSKVFLFVKLCLVIVVLFQQS